MQSTTTLPAVTEIGTLAISWQRHLRAANLSPKTISNYLEAARQFERFLIERGMPTAVHNIRREHVESFIEELLATISASTAATRYRQLQQFFRWLLDDGEIPVSPMVRMRPPRIDEKQVPVIPKTDVIKLLDACSGRDFEDRRDTAIIRMFIGTGARLSEISNLQLDELDLDLGEASVTGKGNRPRLLALTPKVIKSLDRYHRDRRSHKDAELPWLWLGPKGRLTDSGVYQMVERRCKEAGITPIHPHQFRHTYAHLWLHNYFFGVEPGEVTEALTEAQVETIRRAVRTLEERGLVETTQMRCKTEFSDGRNIARWMRMVRLTPSPEEAEAEAETEKEAERPEWQNRVMNAAITAALDMRISLADALDAMSEDGISDVPPPPDEDETVGLMNELLEAGYPATDIGSCWASWP